MTKEEAIEFANCLKNNYTIDFNDMADFCDTVINALEQPTSDDCVSRQAVDQLCYRFLSHSAHEIAFYEHFCDLPPVTPTRKRGLHWIERFDNTDKWLECPHCHKDSDNAYNYCPNCGADMRGRE